MKASVSHSLGGLPSSRIHSQEATFPLGSFVPPLYRDRRAHQYPEKSPGGMYETYSTDLHLQRLAAKVSIFRTLDLGDSATL